MKLDTKMKDQCRAVARDLFSMDAVCREIKLDDFSVKFNENLVGAGNDPQIAMRLVREVRDEIWLRLFLADRDEFRKRRAMR
ncbi:MAG: hypothetical protein EKK29_05825 [Hyphomicrobiales bacterium]|nr:MAG: hypothetical protein EKK29_05825 [Hyphomicrobiales bacterium]